jgi:hypothetical protein
MSYERIMRPFVEANQALATKAGGSLLLPRTPKESQARNRTIEMLASSAESRRFGDTAREVHGSLRLPTYPCP